ncbi:hypothetical protein [Curtobacterium sp. MCBA15_008]|uniref:hypothetical protein n=1 Tax=Curtobacterium sp. MCBA15_008 TaxID=1898736 RepID=UPI0008DE85BB|nr:hypothetical protein [Curtobacterium sp. MCBA15_008]OII04035.1 hypothetical protein BIU96_08400 [Curtobacterium sp. MCBA15_008]
MKRLIAPIALAATLALTGCSATNPADAPARDAATPSKTTTSTPTPKAVVIPDLAGDWKQNNSASDDGWMTAAISGNTITANFVTDNGDTTSLFWVGTFTPPTDDTTRYTWTSTRDTAATDTALLASTDATKDFTYENDEISFPVSIAGSTATVRLSKQ